MMKLEIGDKLWFSHDDGWLGEVVDHVCLTKEEIKILRKVIKNNKELDILHELPTFDALIFLKTKKNAN